MEAGPWLRLRAEPQPMEFSCTMCRSDLSALAELKMKMKEEDQQIPTSIAGRGSRRTDLPYLPSLTVIGKWKERTQGKLSQGYHRQPPSLCYQIRLFSSFLLVSIINKQMWYLFNNSFFNLTKTHHIRPRPLPRPRPRPLPRPRIPPLLPPLL